MVANNRRGNVMKKMKYFIAGTLVGAVVMTAGSAIAAEVKQLVGTKVGSVWELHVDGKVIGEVPIINGNSYGPVRQIAEIAGMDVDFEPGKVFLETKEAAGISESSRPEVIKDRISVVKTLVDSSNNAIAAYETLIKQEKDSSSEAVLLYKAEIEKVKKRIAEYEAEIATLEAELAAAEATK
jgi:uncharacterized small protein (DUF1192 family)